jgi:hypothetical protein
MMKPKVYIDGANIAHKDNKTICASRIKTALNKMQKLGFESHALLPSYMEKKVIDAEIFKKLIKEEQLSLISNDDDEALISMAYEKNAFILTNDRFKDHKDKDWWSPKIEEWIRSKLIVFEFIEGDFLIPMSERNRLSRYLKDPPTPQMSVIEFKKHATNGGISSDIPFEALPEPVQKMLKLIQETHDKTTIAALGSQLKTTTGFGPNDLFGNIRHVGRFLNSRGFSVRHDNNNLYVKGVAE